MAKSETQQDTMMHAEPQEEHRWLGKLEGEWTYEGEAAMEPGQPAEKFTGTERIRSLGGLWFVAEGVGESAGGDAHETLLTLGYDPRTKNYVGTFVASMMTHLWVYETGALDADRRALTLESDGPSMTGDGKLTRYRDVIEFRSDDHRVLTSFARGDDGWQQMMSTHYRRKR